MPSDHLDRILSAFSAAHAAWLDAVKQAAEEVRAAADQRRQPVDGRAPRLAAELGVFAAGHVDAERFAAVLVEDVTYDAEALTVLERALATLTAVIVAGDSLFHIDLHTGADLGVGTGHALAARGRAFGAARVAELVRTGRTAEVRGRDETIWFPFGRWTRAERRIAPPLVIEVDGVDAQVGALVPFLDGAQKIALVMRPPAPLAALVRLITPGVFVMQTTDPADFERFAAFAGPGVAALVPEAAARFIHDPDAPEPLHVLARPEPPAHKVGTFSVFQQVQELLQLEALARALAPPAADRATPPPAAGEAAVAAADTHAEPADQLASWLLVQAGLAPAG